MTGKHGVGFEVRDSFVPVGFKVRDCGHGHNELRALK